MILVAAWLAIAFGTLGAILEVLRNWPDWQWWPFWVVDYIAAGLLIVGGVLALRRRGERVLAGGWGFACAMFWMSFFSHLGGLREAVEVSAREQRLTLIIGVMFAVTACGLLLTLLGRSRRP